MSCITVLPIIKLCSAYSEIVPMDTDITINALPRTRLWFTEWYSREPVLARFTLGVLLLIPLLLLASAVDERTLNGINIWTKPIKFNVAIALYLGTLVWFSGWVNRQIMRRTWYRLYTYVLCGTLFLMLPWLYGAALVGEPAHYNRTHTVLAPLYSLMGVVSVIFTTGALVVALLIATNRASPLNTYFRHAVVWSLTITFVFTVVMAGELASMDSHWIGGTPSDINGLWPFGWSRDGGDLRVAHFFSLHAMHFVPFAALLSLPKLLALRPRFTAFALSLFYCTVIVYVYMQAKKGLPFLPWLG